MTDKPKPLPPLIDEPSKPPCTPDLPNTHVPDLLHTPDPLEKFPWRFLSYTRFIKYTRYLAYSNELGESFRKLYPRLLGPSYALAFGYIGADIGIQTAQASSRGNLAMGITALDKTLWHGMASIALPGLAIHQTVHHSHRILDRVAVQGKANHWRAVSLKRMARVQRFGPTILGLSLIPFIVKPIDHAVDWLMDRWIRPVYQPLMTKND